MNYQQERIARIWRQGETPVLLRRGKGKPLLFRLPYRAINRQWIQAGRRTNPTWAAGEKFWIVPKAWFNSLVQQSLETFGKVYVIQPFREQEICAPACWNALGDECQCSCMGEHHGKHSPSGRWRVISDTFATSWGDEQVACRLITASPGA